MEPKRKKDSKMITADTYFLVTLLSMAGLGLLVVGSIIVVEIRG
jgi:hypothetical protein